MIDNQAEAALQERLQGQRRIERLANQITTRSQDLALAIRNGLRLQVESALQELTHTQNEIVTEFEIGEAPRRLLSAREYCETRTELETIITELAQCAEHVSATQRITLERARALLAASSVEDLRYARLKAGTLYPE
jgi:hypothetical protein